jgi:hypothetical protein
MKRPMRGIPAIAALGAAGCLGVAACTAVAPAIQSPRPSAPLAAPTGNDGVARNIGRIVVGSSGLNALDNGDGRAILAVCDPGTVYDRPGVGTLITASCGINYSDGSVWRQKVTVTFNIQGNPTAAWTELGTELLPPVNG